MKGGIEKRLLIHAGERGNVLYFLLFFLLVSAGMAIGRRAGLEKELLNITNAQVVSGGW